MYWHVEPARHDVILAEDLPCESYLDSGNRCAFANGGDVVEMHRDFAWRRRCGGGGGAAAGLDRRSTGRSGGQAGIAAPPTSEASRTRRPGSGIWLESDEGSRL
jgi:hypothetical protein